MPHVKKERSSQSVGNASKPETITPALRSWIENVFVPNLVTTYIAAQQLHEVKLRA